MMHDDEHAKRRWHPATQAVRAGQHRSNEQEQSEPIFLSSSFTFESAAQAAVRFAGEEPGNIYARFSNPTVSTFQERLAAMEGGEACIATASGMAAILTLAMAVLRSGDRVVCARQVFGTTVGMFANLLPRFGIETRFVDLTDSDAWARAICPRTRLLYLESPSNPLAEVGDIAAIAAIAHAHDCLLVVDNCFCTSALQRPLDLGADVVIHSATKYLDGQGRCLGGAVVGRAALIDGEVFSVLRTAGTTMSAFNAWVFLKGLETLAVRMRGHCENALALAHWLREQPTVRRVNYPGLPDHPQHALAARQQSGFGGVLSFEVDGGREAAWRIIDNTQLMSRTANLGDTKSTITHPATTTHGRMSVEEREAAGIREGLVRISVGLEDVRDLQADLERALGQGGRGA
jgi:O-succinylhomoserine sulfhydrylase